MEWIVTIIFFSLAAYMMFSGSKMSSKDEQKDTEEMNKRWDEIKKKK